jgi:glycosyltransferase involved in cell wall biosynthesis
LPRFKNTWIEYLVGDIKERPNILQKLYKSYRAVIAPTKFLSQAYIDNGLTVPIHISHFGVDSSRAPKPRRDSGVPIRFAFIGQIYPHKGTDILIEAFCRLPQGTAELFIYGNEDQSPEYTNRLKNMASGCAVFFRGTFPQTEIDKIFAEVDFLVIPSIWYENSPLVLLNALASHTPVIVSDVAGMTEFVEDGKNGYIFKRKSVNDLYRVLQIIISEPGKAREMSSKTNYPRTTKMMVEDVVSIYNSIMKT